MARTGSASPLGCAVLYFISPETLFFPRQREGKRKAARALKEEKIREPIAKATKIDLACRSRRAAPKRSSVVLYLMLACWSCFKSDSESVGT